MIEQLISPIVLMVSIVIGFGLSQFIRIKREQRQWNKYHKIVRTTYPKKCKGVQIYND